MSTAGSLSNKNKAGFTLIELIVVISIVATLLLFTFPVFRHISLFSESATQINDMVRLINDLKKRAVEQDTDFLLHIDSGSGMLWVTDAFMDDEAKEAAKDKGVRLSEGIAVLDVEFPGVKETGALEYTIRFRKNGYSDFALIHMIEDKNNITLKIEPFLWQAQVLDRQVHLDDCI